MKSVVFCGSIHLADEMQRWAEVLKPEDVKVYVPTRKEGVGEWDSLTNKQQRQKWQGFVDKHNQAIREHDVIFVFNTEGRIGQNTVREIGYASALDKPMYAAQPDEELGIDTLFHGYCATPQELVKVLKV